MLNDSLKTQTTYVMSVSEYWTNRRSQPGNGDFGVHQAPSYTQTRPVCRYSSTGDRFDTDPHTSRVQQPVEVVDLVVDELGEAAAGHAPVGATVGPPVRVWMKAPSGCVTGSPPCHTWRSPTGVTASATKTCWPAPASTVGHQGRRVPLHTRHPGLNWLTELGD